MQSSTRQERTSRVFYGWWVTAACSAMIFIASGIYFRGFSVFFPPVRDSLGLSNAQTALVFSIARAEGGLEGPLAGWAIDRFGNRALLLFGILLAAVGYFAFATLVDDFWSFAIVYLGLVSLGNSVGFQHAMFAGLNQWFRRRRSLALSLLAANSSLGGLALVPIMSIIVLNLSWQTAAFISGIAYLAIILPMVLLFRNRPEDMGLLPDGDAAPPTITAAGRGGVRTQLEVRDYTVKEAIHTRTYWLLLLGAGLRQVATLGILVNIVPILQSQGASAQGAANLTGLMFGINFVSRLVIGYLGDRISKAYILSGTMALNSMAFVALFFGSWDSGLGLFFLLVFITLQGLGDGAGVIVWSAIGEYYGRDRFASLRGIITFSHSWAQIGAPVFTGWVFDQFTNYDWAILPSIVFAALSCLCFSLIRKPPQLTKAE